MPTQHINFRREIEAGVGLVLGYRIRKSGILVAGFSAFPPGCANAVDVRLLLAYHDGAELQLCPTNNQFLSLDDATIHYPLDEEVEFNDEIRVEYRNNGANPHEINTVISMVYTPETAKSTRLNIIKARAEGVFARRPIGERRVRK